MSDCAYLTTRGRRTGQPHTIEIWYGELDGTVYLLSGAGERADWVNNVRQEPRVLIRFGGERAQATEVEGTYPALARIVTEPAEQDLARRLVAARYESWREGEPFSAWIRDSLVIAVDMHEGEQPGG